MTRVIHCIVAAALLYGGSLTAQAQDTDQKKIEVTAMPVVYSVDGMDKVHVERDKVYRTVDGASLTMDVYYPASYKKGESLPAVVFINGIGSRDLKTWRAYSDWARLTAASGMIAVTYTSRPKEARSDTEHLFDHLRSHTSDLGVDGERLGIWAGSANTLIGFPVAMQKKRSYVRCAVMYYGLGMAPEIRHDIPIFIARCGQNNYMTNAAIDNFVRTAVQEDIDLTLVNYVDGHHAFDIWNDTDEARQIIRQTLEFMKLNLSKPAAKAVAERSPTPSRFVAVANDKGIAKAIDLYRITKKQDPKAMLCEEATLNLVAYYFLQEERTSDAIEIFKLLVEEHPESPNVYDSMADGYAAAGDAQQAVKYAEKAIAMLEKDTTTHPEMKDMIRKSAEDKLEKFGTKAATPARTTKDTKPEG